MNGDDYTSIIVFPDNRWKKIRKTCQIPIECRIFSIDGEIGKSILKHGNNPLDEYFFTNMWNRVDSVEPNTGQKYDAGKLQYSLLPVNAIEEVVRVLGFGAEKYGRENWRKLDNLQNRYYDATLRHLIASQKGEDLDDESGLHHLAHALCCILFKLEDKLKNK